MAFFREIGALKASKVKTQYKSISRTGNEQRQVSKVNINPFPVREMVIFRTGNGFFEKINKFSLKLPKNLGYFF